MSITIKNKKSNKIIEHWCIHFVWLKKYYEKKYGKSGNDYAFNLTLIPLLIYLMLYIIVPCSLLYMGLTQSKGDYTNLLKENRGIFILLLVLLLTILLTFFKWKTVKIRIDELEHVVNWFESEYYKKGRKNLRFHIVFTFLSIPISFILGFFILKLTQ